MDFSEIVSGSPAIGFKGCSGASPNAKCLLLVMSEEYGGRAKTASIDISPRLKPESTEVAVECAALERMNYLELLYNSRL